MLVGWLVHAEGKMGYSNNIFYFIFAQMGESAHCQHSLHSFYMGLFTSAGGDIMLHFALNFVILPPLYRRVNV